MSFLNSLSFLGWGVLLSVPPLIVLLYFLKLKRAPLVVPSTYLWSRAIEDMHVNTIWQKLRRNILLWLQLLFVALLILAVLRPGNQAMQATQERLVLLLESLYLEQVISLDVLIRIEYKVKFKYTSS